MKIVNILVIIAVITVNALANILPINGVGTGEVSAQYENYFTPAGFTFSIWSIIYLSLLVFGIYQFVSKEYSSRAIGPWLVINGLANIGWIYAWHYQVLSVTILLMLVLLASLIFINLRIGNSSWFVKVPFRIYFGWICVATVANVSVWLTYLEWGGWGIPEVVWGMLLVSVAGALAVFLSIGPGIFLAALTIAWGVFGIYKKQIQLERAEDYQLICLSIIGVILVSVIWRGSGITKYLRSSK